MAAPCAEKEEPREEYLCTLQPDESSAFAQALRRRRALCKEAGFDVDSTGLFPPHVSVTGFFSASARQAASVCDIVASELRRVAAGSGGGTANWQGPADAEAGMCAPLVRGVVATPGGHVLLDVVAPRITELSQAVACRAVRLGIAVRPKAVRHLSLASGRTAEECKGISELYKDVFAAESMAACSWDLVVSRVVRRSDVDELRRSGQAHVFRDIVRLRLPSTQASVPALLSGIVEAGGTDHRAFARPTGQPSAGPMTPCDAATPQKRRHWPAEQASATPLDSSRGADDGGEITPVKVAKVETQTPGVAVACDKAGRL